MNAKNLHDAPLAITPDGTVVANITHVRACRNAVFALKEALASGRPVFIGIAMADDELLEVRLRLDDAAAEAVAVAYRDRG